MQLPVAYLIILFLSVWSTYQYFFEFININKRNMNECELLTSILTFSPFHNFFTFIYVAFM